MPLDKLKELTPVFYRTDGLKIIPADYIFPNRWCFGIHWHERMEILLIVEGSLEFHVGNQEAVLSAGHAVIMTPEQLHYGSSGPEGVAYYTIMFDLKRYINGLAAAKDLLTRLIQKQTVFRAWTDQPEIIALLKSMISVHQSEERCDSLMAAGKVYELIALLYRHCLVSEGGGSIPDDRFREVLDFVNLHFTEDISSDGLSRKFGYSLSYFSRHFKEVTGLSPMIYIRILRLEKAGEMLRECDCTFGEIAARCGFSDVSYFTKCFKEHFGLTPTDYVKNIKPGG